MTMPAPVGDSARARNAANRLRSDAVRMSGIESIAPPAMGAIGGRLSESKHRPPLWRSVRGGGPYRDQTCRALPDWLHQRQSRSVRVEAAEHRLRFEADLGGRVPRIPCDRDEVHPACRSL